MADDERSLAVSEGAPDEAALAVSARLQGLIRQEAAAAGGHLPFDRFMELALYAPGLGYYVSGTRKLGAGGDFVTAPELSPLFGQALALHCAEVLRELDGGDILELGAGSGALAAELLRTLSQLGDPPARYLILELSPDLKERQRQRLGARVPEFLDRVRWIDRPPSALHGVVIANEVVDAMPVHRFRVGTDGSPQEIFVEPMANGFAEVAGEVRSPGLVEAVHALQAAGLANTPGYSSEINLRMRAWLSALAASVERGMLLCFDYGYPGAQYYQPSRRTGTLMCHYQQQAHPDPYRHIGLQDITAHVDFSALAEYGTGAGFRLAGYTTQAHFLIGCGIERLLAEAAGDTIYVDLLMGAKQLLLPGAMGERFRVLGLSKGMVGSGCGFAVRDLRDRL